LILGGWLTSRLEHFKRENVEKWLKEAGIDYVWMGEGLGGYRKGGYERYVEAEAFKQWLKRPLKLASKKRVCLLCLEVSLGVAIDASSAGLFNVLDSRKTRLPLGGGVGFYKYVALT